MAHPGYWSDQFRRGTAEALALDWVNRLSTIERMEAYLTPIEPSALVEKTGGKYGAKDLGKAVVLELKLVQAAIEELENCTLPIVKEMLSGLGVRPNKETGVEKWSFGLENHMSEALGHVILQSSWWLSRSTEVRREAVKFNIVKKVTKS